MKSFNKRVVTYLSEKHKAKLQALCNDLLEKEAALVRQILKEYLDKSELSKKQRK